ncbi:putative Polycomb group protein ASXL2 [Nematostella vectensis]|uniref:putative Polycomb group protein ASXL2 n=1 Tax=Nematostella vectensis TaxID=45351 RepID=UPI002077430D|nr:putative Polycomb group protein ASXL2 [Nematostella vectensis]
MSAEKSDIKRKSKGLTWAEASKMVLERSDRPMTHKEILKVIKEENLRDVSNPSTLACLNAMLHHHSRGPDALFYKVDGRMSCYGMKKHKLLEEGTGESIQKVDRSSASPSNSTVSNPPSLSSDSEPSTPATNALSPPQSIDHPPTPMEVETTPSPTVIEVPDIAREETLICGSPTEKEVVFQPKVAQNLIPPQPRKAANSRSKVGASKRSQKARPRGGQSAKKPRLSSTRPRPVAKNVLKNLKVGHSSPAADSKTVKVKKPVQPPPSAGSSHVDEDMHSHTTPQIAAARNMVKFSGLVTKKQRRYKKMGVADQIKRTKEGRVDLQSPESILASVPLRSLLNHRTFTMLPPAYQYQLLLLLPKCDRIVGQDNGLRPSITAFTNEFFTSNCQMWRERLRDGEFTPEMQQRLKIEEEKQIKLDPWKAKYFEPIWGQKNLSPLDAMMPPQFLSPNGTFTGLFPDNLTLPWKPADPNEIDTTATKAEALVSPGKATKRVRNNLTQPLTVPVHKLPSQVAKGRYSGTKAVRVSASRKSDAAKRLEKANAVSIVLTKTQAIEALTAIRTTEPTDMVTAEAFLTRKRAVREPAIQVQSRASALNQRKTTTCTETSKTEANNPAMSSNSLSESQASVASRAVANPLPPTKSRKELSKTSVSKSISSLMGSSSMATIVTKNFKGTIPKNCVCRMKAMKVCRMCGAFCHDDCITAAHLCSTCVN